MFTWDRLIPLYSIILRARSLTTKLWQFVITLREAFDRHQDPASSRWPSTPYTHDNDKSWYIWNVRLGTIHAVDACTETDQSDCHWQNRIYIFRLLIVGSIRCDLVLDGIVAYTIDYRSSDNGYPHRHILIEAVLRESLMQYCFTKDRSTANKESRGVGDYRVSYSLFDLLLAESEELCAKELEKVGRI